jgi:hypothetical protein
MIEMTFSISEMEKLTLEMLFVDAHYISNCD